MPDKISHYQELTTPEKTLIQLLAVAYEPLTRSAIVKLLNRLGIMTERGILYTNKFLPDLLRPLHDRGLITLAPETISGDPELMLFCTKEAMTQGTFLPLSETVREVLPITEAWGGYIFKRYPRFLRHLRYELFKGGTWDTVTTLHDNARREFREILAQEDPLVTLFNNPFDGQYLLLFPDFIYHPVLSYLFLAARKSLTSAQPLFDFLQGPLVKDKGESIPVNNLLSYYLTMWGRWREAEPYLAGSGETPEEERIGLTAWHQTLGGHDREAIELFSRDHVRIQKLTGKKKSFFLDLSGLFFILSLLRTGDQDHLAKASQLLSLIDSSRDQPLRSYTPPLRRAVNLLKGERPGKAGKEQVMIREAFAISPFHAFFHILADYWEDQGACRREWSANLADLRDRAGRAGLVWLAAEAAELLARLGVDEVANRTLAASLRSEYELVSVIDAVRLVEPWERTLKALINLTGGNTNQGGADQGSDASQRLVWWLSPDEHGDDCHLYPRLQLRGKGGKWSAGRAVSLKKLAEEATTMAGLTPQDRAVCSSIRASYQSTYRYGYYRHEVHLFTMETALADLAGHPLVFLNEAPEVRIDLVAGEPELVVTRGKSGIKVVMNPKPDDPFTNFRVIKETPTRYKVVRFSSQHHAIAAILQKGLTAPGRAEQLTTKAISALSRVITIHSDLDGGAMDSREVEADPKPHLHLLPYQEGLKAEILVKPFTEAEAWYPPGTGGQKVFAEVRGEKLHAARDLKAEQGLADRLLTSCPTLAGQEVHNGEYLIASPEACLDLLLELKEAGDQVAMEWPQGESLRVRGRASFQSLSLRIDREREWFKASGALTIDESGVISLQKLLALLDQAKGRFVRLDDGSFLALTEEFKSRLEELRDFGEGHGDGIRFSPFASFALEEFSQGAGEVASDRHWQKHLARMNEIIDPELPSTLQAELRDYQLTGFKWLSQLAHWGVGACLADDMGLGKTIQALTALLRLAPHGPSLVVAPLSVLMNWQDEASRFAPTLNLIPFGPGDRDQTLADLKPFDLVISSYGLLQTEAERLAKVPWQTIVLDEAQAIKNMNTKRAKAAMGLTGRFKVITTGTPIENHLGELWSLFDFINPGLLGSFKHFSQVFMTQVSQESDHKTRGRLKKLIQPFMLRRLKSQVLTELPARTEITMRVTMGLDEAALYEAQRRLAVEKLTSVDAEPQGQQQIRIFAEIMRLRRLCCNPALVLPGCGIESAKLKVFGDLVEEILDNRHKALVFSQFVDHLTILAAFLNGRGIKYQYLDGSTPAAARRERVNAFQAGEGDLFLISLKAGGSGLNLTAADYVIHMDPWWNPAVEDQASDRAHRIGQQRPVTIYRLVMADSIEEQIIKLHQEKRDLADSLLSGGDLSGKLSATELLNLLKEARG